MSLLFSASLGYAPPTTFRKRCVVSRFLGRFGFRALRSFGDDRGQPWVKAKHKSTKNQTKNRTHAETTWRWLRLPGWGRTWRGRRVSQPPGHTSSMMSTPRCHRSRILTRASAISLRASIGPRMGPGGRRGEGAANSGARGKCDAEMPQTNKDTEPTQRKGRGKKQQQTKKQRRQNVPKTKPPKSLVEVCAFG